MAYAAREPRGDGWLLFASVILIMQGIMRIFDAFWAFDRDDDEFTELGTLFWDDNLSAYGWLWLVIGVLLIAAGFGVLSGMEWARWFGIGCAGVAAISAMTWIYAMPIWSMVSTLIAVLVIYALAVYGGRDAYEGSAPPPPTSF